jgi:hypothetical protein
VIALVRFLDGCDFPTAIETLTGVRWQDADKKKAAEIVRPKPKAVPDLSDDDAARIAAALKVWGQGVDPLGTPAEVYLTNRWLEVGADLAGRVLRWHPGVNALMALFRDVRTDEPKAISRLYLDDDGNAIIDVDPETGRKTKRRRFKGPVGGCAVKLDPDVAVTSGLHVTEGIESGMSARVLDARPCWALGSKGALAAFPVIDGVECLTIMAEEDAAREVEACARRWYDDGREVFITRVIGGKDANDVLKGARA